MKKLHLVIYFSIFFSITFAQTTLINPSLEGGFENGTTPEASGWVTKNSSIDKWYVGNAAGQNAGLQAAFISSTGNTWDYTQLNVIQHLYKTITVPALQDLMMLQFKWKANGEGVAANDFDNLKIFAVPLSFQILADNAIPTKYQISGNTATNGMYKLNSSVYNDAIIHFKLTPNESYHIVFSWKSNASNIGNPPAAIDDVLLTCRAATTITSSSIGGLWSSPQTWVGGIVPENENAIIADGATVTIDQVVRVNNLQVGEGASGILQWNNLSSPNLILHALGNVYINIGAKLNMFTARANPNGTYINVGGNFINNGKVHAGYVNTAGGGFHAGIFFNNPISNPVLGGTGTFVNGIISLLYFETAGNATINTTQNITTRNFAAKAGTLFTNSKLSIDNTAFIYGTPENSSVYEVAVTNMGSGYNTSNIPMVSFAAPPNGITATGVPNIDNATGTLRSITITNPGSGYTNATPAVSITGGLGTSAVAIAVVNLVCAGTVTSAAFQSGESIITGGVNIKSNQCIGSITLNNNAANFTNGDGYVTAPLLGMELPSRSSMNLITNGGANYNAIPTIDVSGGSTLSTFTNPTFSVVVAQGKVVSVLCITGGTGWLTLPTLTITGGGGSGATCSFPVDCLATATATIANGAINNFIITNAGFGYPSPTPTPLVSLQGGGFTTSATVPTSRVALYNLTFGKYAPATADVVHQENGLIPINRKVNTLTMATSIGANIVDDVTLYGNIPLSLSSGKLNMNTYTLFTPFPTYTGVSSNAVSSVFGKIKMATQGGAVTRNFPFETNLVVNTGSGALLDGSTLTNLTASTYQNPTGMVNTLGFVTGTKAYRLQTNATETFGTAPTVTLNYNANDVIIADNHTLFIAQALFANGPWDIKSLAYADGVLPTVGARTTATATPGPFIPSGDDYFAWVSSAINITTISSGNWNDVVIWSTGVVPVCADRVYINANHVVTVNTNGNVCKSVVVANTAQLNVKSIGDLLVGCP